MTDKSVVLGQMEAGEAGVFNSIETGCPKNQHRLASLGLVSGVTVKVIHNTGKGPMTLEIKGARIALGRGIVNRVWVKRV